MRGIWLAMVACIGASGVGHAATPSVSLDWETAIQLARHAPAQQAADAAAAAARARAAEARAAAWPQVTLSGLTTPWQKAPDVVVPDSAIVIQGFPLPGFSFEARTARRYAASLDVTQPLWTGGRLAALRHAAHDGAEAAEAMAARTADDIALAVTEAYAGALLAGELAAVARADSALRATLADAAHQRERLGELASIDRLAADADAATASAALVAADAGAATAREALALAIGAHDTLAVEPRGTLEDLAAALTPAAPAATAATERSDVRAARLAVRAAESQFTAARRARWPQIGAVARLAYQNDDLGHLVSPDTRVSSLGIGVSVPLFDGGALSAQARAAAAGVEAAEARARALTDRAAFDVRRARADTASTAAELGARALAARLAAERAAIAARAFRTGIVSARDADAAAVGARAADASRAEAAAQRALALARLAHAEGRLR